MAIFRLDDWVLDETRETLHRGGAAVGLPIERLRILLSLVRADGGLVSVDALCDAAGWRSEGRSAYATRAVHEIKKAFRRAGSDFSYQAERKSGYRVIARWSKEDEPKGGGPKAFSWEAVQVLVDKINRQTEKRFAPQVLVTMSGPGSVAACLRLAVGTRDVPLLVAVTFPKASDGSSSAESQEFKSLADVAGWISVPARRWDIFLPSILRYTPPQTRVLILDDRVVTGESQRLAREELTRLGLTVKLAALLAPPSGAAHLDFVGHVEDGDFVFPWGHKNGRTS